MGSKGDYCVKMRKFDLKNMKQNSIVVVIGKRASGKSTLVKDILFHNNDIPAGCVISGTEEANGYYSEMIPSILIKGEYSAEHVKKLLNRQRAMFPLGLPPMLCTNIDYVFIMRDNIPANKKRIFDSYGGMFGSFPIFCQVVDKITENYGCLVIDQTSTSNNILDTVFWYKAEMHPPFKLCSEKLWRMDQMYKVKKEREQPEEKNDELQLMKKAPRVFVQKLMDS
eukprot:gene19664-biopygen28494